MWNWYSNKERINISIDLAYSISFDINRGLIKIKVFLTLIRQRNKSFWPEQMYTAFRKLKTYDNLFCVWEFKKSARKVWIWIWKCSLLVEYQHPKQDDLFLATKRNTISDDMITVFAHNTRSILKHISAAVSDDK